MAARITERALDRVRSYVNGWATLFDDLWGFHEENIIGTMKSSNRLR